MTELNGTDVVACCHLVAGVSTRISADSHRSSPVNSSTNEATTENVTSENMETTHSQEHAENGNNAIRLNIHCLSIIYNLINH